MNTPKSKSPIQGLSPMWQKSVQHALAKAPRRLNRTGSPLDKKVANSPLRKNNISPLQKTVHITGSPSKTESSGSKETRTRTSQVLSPLSQKILDKRSNTPKKSNLKKEAIGPIASDSPCKKKSEPKKVYKICKRIV